MANEPERAEQSELLPAEVGEDNRAARRSGSEQPRELNHCGRSRRVVVSAVPDGVFCLWVLGESGRAAEVVEVCSNDDVFITENGVGSTKKRNHVFGLTPLGAAHVRVFG